MSSPRFIHKAVNSCTDSMISQRKCHDRNTSAVHNDTSQIVITSHVLIMQTKTATIRSGEEMACLYSSPANLNNK